MFWQKLSSEVSPGLVVRQKWHQKSRNLKVGDLVMICEPTKMNAKYKLGVIEAVKESGDGCVPSCENGAVRIELCIHKFPAMVFLTNFIIIFINCVYLTLFFSYFRITR